jgi:hypothetical protein
VERSCCCLCEAIDMLDLDLHLATTGRLYLDNVLIQHARTRAKRHDGCCCAVKTILDRSCCCICDAIDKMSLHSWMSCDVKDGCTWTIYLLIRHKRTRATRHDGCCCSVKTPVERSCCCLCEAIDMSDLHFATTGRS